MMRMFPSEETEQPQPLANPPAEDDAVLQQAIDTVARRLVTLRAAQSMISWGPFREDDWERIEARATELVREINRAPGPFAAAYKLLKTRANHDVV